MRSQLRVLFLVSLATALARGERARPAPPTIPRCEAGISTWICHVEPVLLESSLPTLADLVGRIPPETRLVIAVGPDLDTAQLWDRLGLVERADARITVIDEVESLSPWARDRYVIFDRDDEACVLLPRADTVASDKTGDLTVARRVAEAVGGMAVVQSELDIEGGDLIVTDQHVLVGIGTIVANQERCEGGVEAHLEELFDREVVVVGETEDAVPHVHLDMYLSAVGPRRLLLGDPRLAEGYFKVEYEPDAATDEARSIGAFGKQTQDNRAPVYDAIAEQLKRAGFRIERIPILHTDDDDLVTWNNVVTEHRGTKSQVYVPTYGIPVLDRAAHECWRKLGYQVHPVNAARIIRHGGAIRCLSNVVRAPAD